MSVVLLSLDKISVTFGNLLRVMNFWFLQNAFLLRTLIQLLLMLLNYLVHFVLDLTRIGALMVV